MAVETVARGTETRWARAIAAADNAGLDALYVAAGANFRWLAGASPYVGGLPIWLSALIAPVEGPAVAVISSMHAEILDFSDTGVREIVTYDDGDEAVAVLKNGLRLAGIGSGARLGVEANLQFSDSSAIREAGPDVGLWNAQAVFDRLRAVKDEDELDLLRRSGRAVDAAYAAARGASKAGAAMSEVGVAMYRAMLDAGAELPRLGGAFKRYNGRPLAPGAIVDIDIGADVGGYSVDTARNLFIGEPTDQIAQDYATLEQAYAAAVEAAKPGVSAERVHEACAQVVAESGHRQSWKVGHGVGLAPSHEAPLLQPGNRDPLEENMVFTIDPGYFMTLDEPLHIEETVVLTKTGCERLTTFPLGMLVSRDIDDKE